jgi:hypothetical protein
MESQKNTIEHGNNSSGGEPKNVVKSPSSVKSFAVGTPATVIPNQ